MRRTLLAIAITLCLAFAGSALALAHTVTDYASGLTVIVPPVYSIDREEHGKDEFKLVLKPHQIPGSECSVSCNKKRIPDYQRLSPNLQNWENGLTTYAVQETHLIAQPRRDVPSFDENYPLLPPPKYPAAHILSVFFKTPDGYLTISCRGRKSDLAQLRRVLDLLVQGISFPER